MANNRAWIVQLTVQTAAVRGGTGTLVDPGARVVARRLAVCSCVGVPWTSQGLKTALHTQRRQPTPIGEPRGSTGPRRPPPTRGPARSSDPHAPGSARRRPGGRQPYHAPRVATLTRAWPLPPLLPRAVPRDSCPACVAGCVGGYPTVAASVPH